MIKWSKFGNYFFNFDKIEFLRITNEHPPILTTYNMESNIIKQVSSVKYLGITMNKNFQHISNITNNTLGFLHRILKICPPHIISFCYKSLVALTIKYGSTVWDPHLHKGINKIEKNQRHAARFVKNDYSWNTSVTSLISKIKKN